MSAFNGTENLFQFAVNLTCKSFRRFSTLEHIVLHQNFSFKADSELSHEQLDSLVVTLRAIARSNMEDSCSWMEETRREHRLDADTSIPVACTEGDLQPVCENWIILLQSRPAKKSIVSYL